MSLEALQRKIKTTQELRDIVSTMKTLSSVSILQYEQANKALDKYRQNLKAAFQAYLQTYGVPPDVRRQAPLKPLEIVIGSDNGMVGKFNRELLTAAKRDLYQNNLNPAAARFIAVGKRPAMLIEGQNWPLLASYGISNSAKVATALAESLILQIDQATRSEHINQIVVWYHKRHKNNRISIEKYILLPFNTTMLKKLADQPWSTNNIPLVPHKKQKMYAALVRETLQIALISFLNFSLAAEHYTRMTNMQNAEKNIDENLAVLNQEYQQQRQEEITDELIDVISGVEALKEKK